MLENEDSRRKKKRGGGVRTASWVLFKEQEASLGDSEENARNTKAGAFCHSAWTWARVSQSLALLEARSVLKAASPQES